MIGERCAGRPQTSATFAIVLAGLGVVAVSVLPATVLAEVTMTPTHEPVLTAVIVTARKIEEDVQDVPMSLLALPRDFLDEADLTRLYELQFSIPGLVVNNVGLFGARFTLRGIAAQAGNDQSIALHLNGVYLGDTNLAIARSFDVERVEVLKGPQGTLYGSNATGGSINFISRAPEHELGAELEAAYGSYATTRAQGNLNLPIRNAAVRLAFVASEGDGYIRNSVDDRRFAENDFWGLRASFAGTIGERLRFSMMAQRVKDDGASGDLWTPNPDFLVDPSDIHLTTVTLPNPYLRTENDNVDLTVEYELAFGTLRSITGYGRSYTENLDDCAGTPDLRACVRGGELGFRQWSEELQLRLQGFDDIDGLVGLYFFDADRDRNFRQHLPLVGLGLPVGEETDSRERSAAIFGQATLHFADRWSVTGGLRLSRDENRTSSQLTRGLDEPLHVAGDHESDELSWRVDLQYDLSDDIMLYGGVASGYKSGGVVANLMRLELDEFGPEGLLAYEAGGKSRWLDERLTLNASAFYYDFEDLQVSIVELAANGIANAARAELYGIDANGVFAMSDRLDISGGVVWMPKREFVEFEDGDRSFAGNELVRAPEWSAAAAVTYTQPVRQLGDFSARIEYSYRSRYYFTRENTSNFEQDGFGLLNLLLRFESNDGWYAFASGRNLTSEDYFNQVFLQSNPGYPDTYEIGAGYRF